MIMKILTGNGGDSVLFARYTGGGGGFCPCQQKRVGGGILSGGDFVLHSCMTYRANIYDCNGNRTAWLVGQHF